MSLLIRFRWILFSAILLGLVLILINLPPETSEPIFAGLIVLSFMFALSASKPKTWGARWIRHVLETLLRMLPDDGQSMPLADPLQSSQPASKILTGLAEAEPIEVTSITADANVDSRITVPRISDSKHIQYAFDPRMWHPWQRLLGLLSGLALMFAGQLTVYRGSDFGTSMRGYTLLVIGIIVFFATVDNARLRENGVIPLPTSVQRLPIRWLWLAVSIGSAAWNAYLTVYGRDYTYLGEYVFLWLLSMLALMMAVSPRKGEMTNSDTNPLRKWEYGLLLVLFLAAFAIRGINLSREPYLLDSDEAKLANEGASFTSQNFRITPFEPGADAHPRIYMAMIGVSTKLFGINLFGARLPSVLLGALTIPALYLLGREMRDWQAGLVAALFLLGWSFHIEFSRLALNEPADPLFATLAFYFLLRGLRRGTASDYALSGIMTGIGQLFYIAGRLIPLVMIAYLIFIWLREREVLKRQWRLLLIIPVAVLIVTLPHDFLIVQTAAPMSASEDHSDILSGRLQEVISQGKLGSYLTSQSRNSFLALISVTDNSPWYGPSSTLMGIVGGPLLLIGVYISLIALWKWPKWSLPLGWAFTVIAAGSTFVTSPPQYERYVAGVAAFSLLVETGIALVALALAKAIKRPNANRSIAVGIGTLVLLGNVAFYLWVYIPEGQYLNLRTNWVANRQANQMLEEYNQGRQVVLVARFDTNIQNSLIVQFLMTGKPYLNGEEDLPNLLTRVDLTKPTSFLVSPQRKDDLTQLIHFFPSGKTFKVYLDENKEFAFYLFRLDSVLKS